jgi:hypothetical protein
MRRRILISVGAVLLLLLLAALALPPLATQLLVSAVQARAEVAGARVAIGGPVDITWLPRPLLRAQALSVASGTNPADPLVRAASLEAMFSWAGLLRGQPEATQLRLRGVQALALPLPPGDVDIVFEGYGMQVAVTSTDLSARLAIRRDAGTVILDTIALDRGRYAATGSGGLTFEEPTRVVLRLERVTRDGAPIGSFNVAASYARDGVLIERATFRTVEGAELSVFGHGSVAAPFRFEGGDEASSGPLVEASARLSATGTADDLEVELTELDARIGEGRLGGTIRGTLGPRSRSEADLRMDRLGVDALAAVPVAALAPFAADETTVRLRIGQVVWAKTAADGVIVDMVGSDGTFDLRELAIRNLGGAPMIARGRFVAGAAAVQAETLALRYGALEGSGSGSVDWSVVRPLLRADLALGPVALEPLLGETRPLPPEPTTRRAAAAAAQAASRPPPPAAWSRERIAFPALPPFDFDVTATSQLVSWHGKRLEAARLVTRWDGETLKVEDLSGKIYGGQLGATGQATFQDEPAFIGRGQLMGGDLRLLLTDVASVDAISGRGDIAAELTTFGDNPATMIGALAGIVRIAGRDGTVTGFDLAAASERLRRMNRPTDLLELARAGSGGRTAFSTLDGLFRIERGVATTEGLRLVARGGEARMMGSINLPLWTLNLLNELKVGDPAGLPPLAIKLSGSIAAPRSIFDIERLQSELLRRTGRTNSGGPSQR